MQPELEIATRQRAALDDAQDRLARRILLLDRRVVLIHALPGAGKTRILDLIDQAAATSRIAVQHRRISTFDLGPDETLEIPPGSSDLWAIVGRPSQIAGFARLHFYGEIEVVGNSDLFIPRSALPDWNSCAGWPAISAGEATSSAACNKLRAFLTETVLPSLDTTTADVLRTLALSTRPIPASALNEKAQEAVAWLSPLIDRTAEGYALATHAAPVAVLREILASEPLSAGAAGILYRAGQPEKTITHLLSSGRRKAALDVLGQSGGVMFGHLHGPVAAASVLNAFGSTETHPGVVALKAMSALKKGQVGRARWLIETALADPTSVGNTELRLARLLLLIYEDRPADASARADFSQLLDELDPDQHLLRGSVYNIALDDQIRRGLTGEVDATAARALSHYKKGNAPYLAFYIHMHLAMMELLAGAPDRAGPHLDRAAAELAKTRFETQQDDRFLVLLRAQTAYERGEPEAMADFARTAFADFAFGELWPTIAALALSFGTEALFQFDGLDAARRHLDGWRVQMWRTRRFRLLVEQREIAVLQTSGKLHEARRKLEPMATRIGRVWMDSAGENLRDLRDPEDIAQALIWLRQQVFERPREGVLAQRLRFMAENPFLSWRHARSLGIWRAWVERRQNRIGSARQFLADALEVCHARKCLAPVLEERPLVSALLDDPRMVGSAIADVPVPRQLRRGVGNRSQSKAADLTRQELRALLLLVEGCSNKEIAHQMGVSLPTAKFHLKNLYRKLGVENRRTAVHVARGRALVET